MMQTEIDCPYHDEGSHKAYKFYHVNKVIDDIIRCPIEYKNKEMLMHSVYAQIMASYLFLNGTVEKRAQINYKTYFKYYVKLHTNKSQILVRPPTAHRNPFRETNIHPSPQFEEIMRLVSAEYMYKYAQVTEIKPGSLVDRCAKVVSFHSVIYEPFSPLMDFNGKFIGATYPRVRPATNDMNLTKQIKLLAEYDTDTNFLGSDFFKIKKLISPAFQITIDLMGVRPYMGTQYLNFKNPKEFFLKTFNIGRGGGASPMPSGTFVHENVKYRVHNTGMKALMLEANARAFVEWLKHIINGTPGDYPDIEIIRQKREWKKILELATLEELKKLIYSMREFFIPSMFHGFVGSLLLRFFKKVIYGQAMKVGYNFNYGGAYLLAKSCHYDDDRIVHNQGDIYKLDKHVQSIIMILFFLLARMMYDLENITPALRALLDNLFKHYIFHSTTKNVLHLGDFFRIEQGKVYSGDLQTSALDCFAMVFVFAMYIQHAINEHPAAEGMLRRALQLYILCIIVYGDDHIWWYPIVLRGIIDLHGFSVFLEQFLNMKIRNARTAPFLTVIDPVTCEIISKGMVFLKKHFIANEDPEYPPVLPFKTTREIIISLGLKEYDATTNTDVEPLDLMLSCIGQAYDSINNPVAYEIVKSVWDKLLAYHGIPDMMAKLSEYVEDPANHLKINKLLRRLHITEHEILTSFPSWDDLMERNKFCLEKCQFGQDVLDAEVDYSLFGADEDDFPDF